MPQYKMPHGISIISSAYVVFHAESLTGIELHLTSFSADHSASPRIRGFENSGHFPAAESALPTVDEPPTDVPYSPHYYYFCVATHVASLLTAASCRRFHCSVVLFICLVLHVQQCRAHRKYICNNCILVAVNNYIHTYMHEPHCNMISCLASRLAIIIRN